MGNLTPKTRVHLVGIGGIGLSAIARVLHGWGYRVSGSDQQPSALTEAMAAEGITIYGEHAARNVTNVVSTTHRSICFTRTLSPVEDTNNILLSFSNSLSYLITYLFAKAVEVIIFISYFDHDSNSPILF